MTDVKFTGRKDRIPKNILDEEVFEKAFMRSKSLMEPLYAHTEGGTRARVFLSILGYAINAMIAHRCKMAYNKAMETMRGINRWFTPVVHTLPLNSQRIRK